MNTGRGLVESIMNASEGLLKLRADADGVLSADGLHKLIEKIGEFMGYLYCDVYVMEVISRNPDLKGLLEDLESKRERESNV